MTEKSVVTLDQYSDMTEQEILTAVLRFIREAQLVQVHPGALLFALEYGLQGKAHEDLQTITEDSQLKDTLYQWATGEGFHGEQQDLWYALTWAIGYGVARYDPAEQKDLYASVAGIFKESRKVFLSRYPEEKEMEAYPVLRNMQIATYNPQQQTH